MNRLKELRTAKGLTLMQLAKELQMDYSTLGHIERGRRGFSVDSLAKACSYFGVSADYMLGASLADIFGKLADAHYGDTTAIRISPAGEPILVYRDGDLATCLKFAILKSLKGINDIEALQSILTLVKREEAKVDFTD